MTVVNGTRMDPARGYRFKVDLGSAVGVLPCKTVSGLERETEVVEYREGTDNHSIQKLPGLMKVGDVTLERGLVVNDQVAIWLDAVSNVLAIRGDGISSPQGELMAFRENVYISLSSRDGGRSGAAGLPNSFWYLHEAWPSKTSWSDLDAMSSDVIMESLVLTYEWLEF